MIKVKVSEYIPKGFAVMVGTLCKKCKKPFDQFTLCVENIPYGHVPDVVILKNIGEAQHGVEQTGEQSPEN